MKSRLSIAEHVIVACVAIAACLMLESLFAAPAPKTDPGTTGAMSFMEETRCPVLTVPETDGPGAASVYWLVFPTRDAETRAKSLGEGDRVRVTGKFGAGGRYKYIVVDSLAKDGD